MKTKETPSLPTFWLPPGMGAQDINTVLLGGCLAWHLHAWLVGVMLGCLPQAAACSHMQSKVTMGILSPVPRPVPTAGTSWGSPALRQVGAASLAGSHACLQLGVPQACLPFTPAPSITPHCPTQHLSRPQRLSGEQRDVFLLSVTWWCVLLLDFCTLSVLEDVLHSDWDKNQGEKELFLMGMRTMGSHVSLSPARLSHGVLA